MEPVIACRIQEFGLNQVQIGIFFIIMPIFYIPTSMYIHKVPNGIEKRSIIISACLISVLVNFIQGPSYILNFPNKLWMTVIG